jgi:hypothetical protein
MALGCPALSASDPAKPPLTDVRFEPAGEGLPSVHIRIAEAQPPGIYVGTIFDAQTGEPRGSLRVTLT